MAALRKYPAAQRGAIGSEYTFLFAFIVFVAITGLVMLGNSIVTTFTDLDSHANASRSEMAKPSGDGAGGESTDTGGAHN